MRRKFPFVPIAALFLFFIINSCKKNEPPIVITYETRSIFGNIATCGGRITDEGSSPVTARGVCWSTGSNPTVSDNKTIDGSGAGTFESQISGLTPATDYYVRAYATNGSGTGYGTVISFSTLGSAPYALTLPPLTVNTNEAALIGQVNPNYAGTEVSFEYGETNGYGNNVIFMTHNPLTVNFNYPATVKISNLTAGTTYHFRVKAVNSLGTTYGDDLTFTTTVPVPDAEGNSYSTVKVGPQTWIAQNLEATRYNDGTEIPLVSDDNAWSGLTGEAYCWYNNDELSSKGIYGALYNWNTVNHGNLCPAGYHVPAYEEWLALYSYMDENIFYFGGALGMNLATNTGWIYSNINGAIGNTDYPLNRNITGFSALPAGIRDADQKLFGSRGTYTVFWTSSESYPGSGKAYTITLSYDQANINVIDLNETHGFSIRCMKD